MLWSFALLFLCQVSGDLVHAVTGLPIPGPVIGMALLLVGLTLFTKLRPEPAPSLPAASGLLAYLPLFFVPPGVSAVMQLGRLLPAWPAVLVGLAGSSILTLAVAGWLAQGLLQAQDRRAAMANASRDPSERAA